MTGRSVAHLVAFAFLIGSGPGCVTQPEYRELRSDVDELKQQQGGVEGGSRLAELGAQMDELRDEIAGLRGEVEEARHAADQALVEVKAAQQVAPSSRAAPVRAMPPPAAPEGALSEEVRTYEEAFRVYRSGDYPTAIDRFRSFLDTHPSSDYADNALFWLAECHYKLGDQEQAVLAFDDVVKRYPEGNKVPDALYRQGVALVEIGDQSGQQDTYRPAARQIFERLVAEHPDSERVPEARRQLEKLSQ